VSRFDVHEWVTEQLALAPAPSESALDRAWGLLSGQTSRPTKTDDGATTEPRVERGRVAPSLANLRESGTACEQEAS
jgi:hypothetical protein